MRIFIGSDHGGFEWKQKLSEYLTKHNYDYEDLGPKALDPDDDYPVYAKLVCQAVIGSTDEDPRGILICRGANGMAIAANRHEGIRASVCWDAYEAKMTRLDNDSNVLCLAADDVAFGEVEGIIETWLSTAFSAAPRHIRRLKQIDDFYPNA